MKVKIEIEAECVADGSSVCLDGKEDLNCFQAGQHGGVCEWLCISKVDELKTR